MSSLENSQPIAAGQALQKEIQSQYQKAHKDLDNQPRNVLWEVEGRYARYFMEVHHEINILKHRIAYDASTLKMYEEEILLGRHGTDMHRRYKLTKTLYKKKIQKLIFHVNEVRRYLIVLEVTAKLLAKIHFSQGKEFDYTSIRQGLGVETAYFIYAPKLWKMTKAEVMKN